MYVIKKLVGLLTKPGTIVLLLLGYSFLHLALSRGSRKKGLWALGLGVVCFYLFSTAPLPNYLVHSLESRYQPINSPQNLADIQYIVVLSEGLRLNEEVPITSRLAEGTVMRVAEGVRLFHLLSGKPVIIMTGGGPLNDMGERMKVLAQALGVPSNKLVAETQSRDTHGNATGVQGYVKKAPFLLVTSASHLPRAMAIFQKLGMKPIPAPADFHFSKRFLFADYFPSGEYLTTMEALAHEYLGLAYLTLWPGRAGE